MAAHVRIPSPTRYYDLSPNAITPLGTRATVSRDPLQIIELGKCDATQ